LIAMHLRSRHGKRESWFEELGGTGDLQAAHAWEHATRHTDHELTDLSPVRPLERAG
jgi:hypothetical protein